MSRKRSLSMCCVVGCLVAACRPAADSKGPSLAYSSADAKANQSQASTDRAAATTGSPSRNPDVVVIAPADDPPAPKSQPNIRAQTSNKEPARNDAPALTGTKPETTPPAEPEPDPGYSLEERDETGPDGSLKMQWMVKVYPDGREVRHGPFRRWHPNGQPYLQGEYLDGKRHGMWLSWNQNGNMRGQGMLDNDERVGKWTLWHENGTKRSETTYENGIKNGPWSLWNEQGQPAETGTYLNGMKHGVWVEFSEEGKIETEWEYGNKIID